MEDTASWCHFPPRNFLDKFASLLDKKALTGQKKMLWRQLEWHRHESIFPCWENPQNRLIWGTSGLSQALLKVRGSTKCILNTSKVPGGTGIPHAQTSLLHQLFSSAFYSKQNAYLCKLLWLSTDAIKALLFITPIAVMAAYWYWESL